jgi:hypothetical protein
VLLGQLNAADQSTSVTSTAEKAALEASNGTANTGIGLAGRATFATTGGTDTPNVGVLGVAGTDPVDVDKYECGVAGYSSFSDFSCGAYGESAAGFGLAGVSTTGWGAYGGGSIGGFFEGTTGSVAIGDSGGTGLHAHVGGTSTAPVPPANTALLASVASTSQVGIEGRGRVRFPNRSGRATISAGRSYVDVSVSGGVTSSMYALAVLQTYRTGIYVAAVRPGYPSSGKIRIYLNKAVTGSTYVTWFVLG